MIRKLKFPGLSVHTNDTIVACATPTGFSGLAIVRLSGKDTIPQVMRVFPDLEQPIEPNHAYYGRIINPANPQESRTIDWGMVTFFLAPHSYTGEDGAEISCHGNPLIVDQIINVFLKLGVRLAEPGEFTLRALLNNKIDLIQAEAVLDTVHATCDEARRLAITQYEGKLSKKIYDWRSRITDLLVIVEANIDFSDDEEEIIYDQKHVHHQVKKVIEEIDEMLEGARSGLKIKNGYRLALVGRTNVGKSTLFNRLLGYDRAIVHETPGTTRDYIEEGTEIKGFYVKLIDTAGFFVAAYANANAGASEVEKISMDRTIEVIEGSDLILLIFDGSESLNEQDIQLYNFVKERHKLMVINKIDLNVKLKESDILSDSIKLSAKTGDNLDMLRESIRDQLKHDSGQGAGAGAGAGAGVDKNLLLTRQRHINAIREVKKCLSGIIGDNNNNNNNNNDNNIGAALETVAYELHCALDIISELTGRVLRKDILDKIFEEFCVGK